MMRASLPIKSDIAEGMIGVDYSATSGVDIGFSSAANGDLLEVYAIFGGTLYWVKGGSTNDGILPGFRPRFDSIILRTWIQDISIGSNICYPLPSFITYENLDKHHVQSSMIDIVHRWWPDFNDARVASVIQEFFDGIGWIWCDVGDLIGYPSAWTIPEAANFPMGFTLKTWKGDSTELIYTHVYLHHLRFVETSIRFDNEFYRQLPFGISAPVGNNAEAANGNIAADLILVRQRLLDLGFKYKPSPPIDGCTSNILVVSGDNSIDSINILSGIIKLFQAIICGKEAISGASLCGGIDNVTGLIEKRSPTEQWLWASQAPRWEELDSGSGYNNSVDTENHDYGTQYLKAVIKKAAEKFINDYWNTLSETTQKGYANAPIIRTNSASLQCGGNFPPHKGHQTGLLVDIKIPRKDGNSGGGITIDNVNIYDPITARAIAISFSSQPETRVIYFNDVSMSSGPHAVNKVEHDPLNPPSGAHVHDNHLHIGICPPSNPRPWDALLGGI